MTTAGATSRKSRTASVCRGSPRVGRPLEQWSDGALLVAQQVAPHGVGELGVGAHPGEDAGQQREVLLADGLGHQPDRGEQVGPQAALVGHHYGDRRSAAARGVPPASPGPGQVHPA